VVAEISELRLNPTGHCYLELVEKQGQKILAKTKATIWANTYTNLSLWFEKMTGSQLKPGMKILCNAAIQYHEVFGMSINIKDIDASFTIGEKAAIRQKTINQLTEDGVLTMNKELTSQVILQHVAIISSPTAAGYEDFMQQLANNAYGYHFDTKLYEAVMQGNTSAQSIIDALHKIHEDDIDYDAIIVIRGGGSQIDLDSYDSYELATHIAQFPIPILTGIGHERDESIADMVSHHSLKTPTAVAEFLIGVSADYERILTDCMQQISRTAKQEVAMHQQGLQKLSSELALSSKSLILTKRHVFSALEVQLQRTVKYQLHDQSNLLSALQHSLDILSPENILKRGYSMTTSNGQLIKQDTNLNKGDELITETSDHIIHSTVTEQKSKT
jgi:exodeoxyribonuclease VII large subunit